MARWSILYALVLHLERQRAQRMLTQELERIWSTKVVGPTAKQVSIDLLFDASNDMGIRLLANVESAHDVFVW